MVLIGVALGSSNSEWYSSDVGEYEAKDPLSAMASYDGKNYRAILQHGYSPQHPSDFAFFPIYPFLSRVWLGLGFSAYESLIVTSLVCRFLSILLFAVYVRGRFENETIRFDAVALFAFFPTMFHYWMAYTESMFSVLVLLVMIGIQSKHPIVWIALIAGVTSGTRLVGLALLPIVAWHVLERNHYGLRGWVVVLGAVPLSASGLIGYVFY